ncbi:MAG: hypothetical protein B0D86_00840, partial [Candidatus Sedimenticola endophacoides]
GLTYDATPTLSGSGGVAGDTLTLYDSDGVSVLATTTVTGDGSWRLTLATLSDGVYDLSATYTDPAGNVSARSPTLVLTIDTVAPVKPATPDLNSASDTGISDTDNVTTDATPLFQGAAGATEGLAIIELSSSVNGARGEATAAADGSWSLPVTPHLNIGDHLITITATDVAGNTSVPSDPLAVTIDTTNVVLMTDYEEDDERAAPGFGRTDPAAQESLWLAGLEPLRLSGAGGGEVGDPGPGIYASTSPYIANLLHTGRITGPDGDEIIRIEAVASIRALLQEEAPPAPGVLMDTGDEEQPQQPPPQPLDQQVTELLQRLRGSIPAESSAADFPPEEPQYDPIRLEQERLIQALRLLKS